MAHQDSPPDNLSGHYGMEMKGYPSPRGHSFVSVVSVNDGHSASHLQSDNEYDSGNRYGSGDGYHSTTYSGAPNPTSTALPGRPRVKSWFAKAWIMELLAAVCSIVLLVVLAG